MKRTRRREFAFDPSFLTEGMRGEARNKLLFDWWCDDGDRVRLLEALRGRPLPFDSRALRQDDPCPPIDLQVPQDFRPAWILSSPAHIDHALSNTHAEFSNIPYATLGGGGFLLAQDPVTDPRHDAQVAFIDEALAPFNVRPDALREFATRAVSQAALTALAASDFDLASFAEQAALRYFALLFGYGFQDHPLLESASRAAYRALQYVAIGRHFATEPLTVPAAQQAVGALVTRTSALSDDYVRLQDSPRRFGAEAARSWPTGVAPWSDLGLRNHGLPLLARLHTIDSALSGRDRATVCSMLLAGTLGNVQSAVCLLVKNLLDSPAAELTAARAREAGELEADLDQRLCSLRPLPVLPRRALRPIHLGDGVTIAQGDDVLLALEAGAQPVDLRRAAACPHVWGGVSDGTAPHRCLGRGLARPLITEIVRHTLRLPGLTRALDPLTGEALDPERLWGFACTSFPLRHDRQRRKLQQNLIVSMRIKAPIAQNAARLRELIASAAPRIDAVLRDFGGVHFAWFEFSDDDTRLILRTIYDGPFEAYIRHFALRAGDLFDGLFEFIEDAPPRPIDEHPDDFVETIRRFNRAPFAGYLYTAYPGVSVAQIGQRTGLR